VPNLKLKTRIEKADLILLVGGRTEAAAQGYALLNIPSPRQTLVHIHPDPTEIGRSYHATLGIATSPEFCASLKHLRPPAVIPWSAEMRRAGRVSLLER
jgi:acetolactate synthase I/II/III large subunit